MTVLIILYSLSSVHPYERDGKPVPSNVSLKLSAPFSLIHFHSGSYYLIIILPAKVAAMSTALSNRRL